MKCVCTKPTVGNAELNTGSVSLYILNFNVRNIWNLSTCPNFADVGNDS